MLSNNVKMYLCMLKPFFKGGNVSCLVIFFSIFFSYKSKKDGKDQETIQSSTTNEPGYHMGKFFLNSNVKYDQVYDMKIVFAFCK